MSKIECPSVDDLRINFHYDYSSGVLRKLYATSRAPAGSIATHKNSNGYLKISFRGVTLAAHRVAFALFTGSHAKGDVDHINGDRTDNRAENLRDVPPNANRAHRTKSTSGKMLGAFWNAQKRRWQAQRGNHHIGWFCTEIEAHNAYIKARDSAVDLLINDAEGVE